MWTKKSMNGLPSYSGGSNFSQWWDCSMEKPFMNTFYPDRKKAEAATRLNNVVALDIGSNMIYAYTQAHSFVVDLHRANRPRNETFVGARESVCGEGLKARKTVPWINKPPFTFHIHAHAFEPLSHICTHSECLLKYYYRVNTSLFSINICCT